MSRQGAVNEPCRSRERAAKEPCVSRQGAAKEPSMRRRGATKAPSRNRQRAAKEPPKSLQGAAKEPSRSLEEPRGTIDGPPVGGEGSESELQASAQGTHARGPACLATLPILRLCSQAAKKSGERSGLACRAARHASWEWKPLSSS